MKLDRTLIDKDGAPTVKETKERCSRTYSKSEWKYIPTRYPSTE